MFENCSHAIAHVLRIAVAGIAVWMFAFSSQASAGNVWVLQGTSAEPSNFGPRNDACIPNVSGGIADGQATVGFQNAECGAGAFFVGQITYHITWDSPPSRIVPGEPVSVRATITRSGDASAKGPSFAELQFITSGIAGQLDSKGMLEDPNWQTSESKTMTLSLYNGDPGAKTDVKVYLLVSDGGGFYREQAGGYFVYHYVLEASEAAPSTQGAPGASASNTSAPDVSAPPPTTTTTTTSDSGTSASGVLDNYETKKAANAAIAAILGGLLISIGAVVAAGLSGGGLSDIGATLSDLLKGKVPNDGFDDWKNTTSASGKVYGSGSPDDPFRNYPDAKNPPWQAPYGDGSAANPFSDTAPPVIDHSPAPDQTPSSFTTTVDMKPVMGSGATPLDPIPTSVSDATVPLKVPDMPLQTAVLLPETPLVPDPKVQALGQIANIAGELEKAADQLKAEGKYIANGNLLAKVWYGVPQASKWGIDWVVDVLHGSGVFSPKNIGRELHIPEMADLPDVPPPQFADPNWGTCEQARDWGEEKLAGKVKNIFGPDAIFTTVMIKSDYNPLGNHIANEVIMPNGDRYVVDMWATMVEGKAKIYPEEEWVKKWKDEPHIGSSVTVVRGGGTSVYETMLADNIRKYGVDEGIAKTRATLRSTPGKVDTVIKSYNRHPWSLTNGEPVHEQDAVLSPAEPPADPPPPDAGPDKNIQY